LLPVWACAIITASGMRSQDNVGMATHTALVTGASTGIGYAVCELLAADGYDLLLTARNEDRLRDAADRLRGTYDARVTTYAADLAAPGAAADLHARVLGDGHAVDVLVNNAGFGAYGPFHEADAQRQVEMLQLNVVALTQLTRLVMPDMLRQGQGRVMNVASTAAFQPGPLMSAYYASKAYVLSFSSGIAHEARGTGVTVTCLCPGPTTSGFQSRGNIAASTIMQGKLLDAATVARVGYRAMHRGRPLVIVGRWNAFLAFLPRLTSRWFAAAVVAHLQRPGKEHP